MEKNQFVYKRDLTVPPIEEDKEKGIEAVEGYTKTVLDSFNIDCVIRSVTMDDGGMLVLLDDIHERYETVPQIYPKTNKPKFNRKGEMMFERIKNIFQSEIHLSEEEAQKFLKLTAINNYE